MSSSRRAELFLLFTTVIWGSTFVVTKGALDGSSPLFFVSLRFLSASLILTVLFFKKVTGITRSGFINGGILGLLLFAGFSVQTIGLQYTTASKSAFFTGTLVVFTPIAQVIMMRKMPKPGNLIGVVLAAIGLYILTSPSGSEFNKGDALTLLCAIMFAIYIVHLDRVSADNDKFALTFGQITVTGVASLISALLFEHIRFDSSVGLFSSLLYLTIFATIITTWTQTRYQGDTQPTRAAVIFTLEPVLAAIFAFFVRDERIGIAGVFGGLIIVVGLIISELSDSIPLLNRASKRSAY
ncbi:MAG TPA: DMT family transporter [Bacteroidota bacterium]|nr:DMT family transporter [Bacteroidota bacterium]